MPKIYNSRYGDPNRKIVKVINLLKTMPAGNYAVQQREGEPFQFYKLTFPEKSENVFAAKTKHTRVQRRSSDDLKEVLIANEIGNYIWYSSESLLNDLLIVGADWMTAARTFAKELGKCARCSQSLTDARSRYYSIGPTCEPRWPVFIASTISLKGSFEDAVTNGTFVG